HVDQFGYLPCESKIAVISGPQASFNAGDRHVPGDRLEVRRVADGAVVFHGAPNVFDDGRTDAISGDRGWWFDFSAVETPGDYVVFDPATGARSAAFRIA